MLLNIGEKQISLSPHLQIGESLALATRQVKCLRVFRRFDSGGITNAKGLRNIAMHGRATSGGS
jgi:hypothetical protein